MRQLTKAAASSAALDMAVAAFAAMAVGFAAWAMPDDLFANIVARSGIISVIPAAVPPFGDAVRIGTAVLAALVAFALLRGVLGSIGMPPARRDFGSELQTALKVRRADAHPDAPAPMPLLAETEIGETAPDWPELEPEETVPDEPVHATLPPRDSIADLMLRLERGLARRAGEADEPAAEDMAATDDRLRDAIVSLQRLAARS